MAASQLDAPVRLKLWSGVFGLFFPWVWTSIAAILATGFWLICRRHGILELGSVLGLAVGYVVKYNLDRRFVFTDSRLEPVT